MPHLPAPFRVTTPPPTLTLPCPALPYPPPLTTHVPSAPRALVKIITNYTENILKAQESSCPPLPRQPLAQRSLADPLTSWSGLSDFLTPKEVWSPFEVSRSNILNKNYKVKKLEESWQKPIICRGYDWILSYINNGQVQKYVRGAHLLGNKSRCNT